MKCHAHLDRDTIASCKECGRGLCLECTNKYHLPYCDACRNKQVTQQKNKRFKELCELKSQNKGALWKYGTAMIWTGIFFILGACLVLIALVSPSKPSTEDFISSLVFVWGLGGIPWVLFRGFLKNSLEEKIVDEAHIRVDPGGGCVYMIAMFVIKIIIGFIIGAIATPFLFINSVVQFRKARERIHKTDTEIDNLNLR